MRLSAVKLIPALLRLASALPAFAPVLAALAAESPAGTEPLPARPPALSAADSERLFELPPGYRIERVLAEPDIREPVVSVFDGNGRLYVAEMRTYMQDVDGTDELLPRSRVSRHWSSRGDGVFDRHSVFIDGLVLPRILLPLRDSLLVQETNSGDVVEYRDTDGDGVADERKVVFSGEARKSNLEHQPSGLIWSVDNWMYYANNAVRLRWTPSGLIQQPTPPNGGQWGATQDDQGKPWFVNAGGEQGPVNFQQPIAYGTFRIRDEFAEGFKEVWPLVPIPDVQGGTARFRPAERTLNHFTATCGGEIYRGDRLPADLKGDLLFCEPVGRLIRRAKVSVVDGVTRLANAYEKSEFLRSRDPYFRPVNLTTAPDGTLYVTDMSRGIIQEGNWTKPDSYLRGVILRYGLEQTIGRGRIWRIVREGQAPGPAPRMLDESPAELVRHLAHPNGWWRDTAQKLLVLAQDRSVVPALTAAVRSPAEPLGRVHALWTLEGLDALTAPLLRAAFADADERVRVAAIRASESLARKGDLTLEPDLLRLCEDPSPGVSIQAILSANLLGWPSVRPVLHRVAMSSPSRGVKEIASQVLNPQIAEDPPGFEGNTKVLARGQQIYLELCFACHGLDGKGSPMEGQTATLAPPLAGSATVTGHGEGVVNILLHGATGPIGGRTYDAQMIALGANSDEWIAAVASYVRVAFGNRASLVTPDDVARWRAAAAGRTSPWTLAELQAHLPRALANRAEWRMTSNVPPAGAKDNVVSLPYRAESPRTPGAWVQVELPESAVLTGVRVVCSRWPRNFPRGYQVELSADGVTWGAPVARGRNAAANLEVSFPPTRARWLRFTQTEPPMGRPWILDDLVLFEQAPAKGPGAVVRTGE